MQQIALVVGILLGTALVIGFAALFASMFAILYLAATARWVPVIYNVRSLWRRKVTTIATLLGVTLVVAVIATALMLRDGIRDTLVTGGQADNVVVLRTGASADIVSIINREQVKLVGALPKIATDPKDGRPLFDPQVAVLISAQRAGRTEENANVSVRGLSERQVVLHPTVGIAEGRWFQPGTSEIVIGRALVGRFVGAQLGGQWYFARRNWTVVGIIEARGSAFGSEIWGDADQVMDAFHRSAFSSVVMRVKDPDGIKALAAKVLADPQLNLDAKQERKYFEDLSNGLAGLLNFLGIFVGIVFSLGATLGATISMYAQVAARTREVGTLRAIGFKRKSILTSFVVESVILGLVAGVAGVALGSLAQFGSFTTINFGTFSEVTFHFKLTPGVAITAELLGGIMGYAGGLLPAIRAARMPDRTSHPRLIRTFLPR